MAGTIYLVRDDKQLTEMAETPYDSESLLQGLLADYPNLLAGDQIDAAEPRRWLLVSRELGLPSNDDSGNRWAVDHLFLDQDGIPTIVEVKRSSDTRIRREVVGQVLEYAANAVVFWPVESLKGHFEERCISQGLDSQDELRELLDPEKDPAEFWQSVTTNLQAGRVRLVFVADVIPIELQRIVEFLNIQMNPAEVLAIEVKQYIGQGIQALVPRVVGNSARRQGIEKQPGRQWDAASIMAELSNLKGAGQAAVFQRILNWSESRGLYPWYGKGAQSGSFYPMLRIDGDQHWLFNIWTYGTVTIQFGMMQEKAPFSDDGLRRAVLDRLNHITGIKIAEDKLSKYPGIPMAALVDPAALDQFLKVFDWVIQEIRNTGANLSD